MEIEKERVIGLLNRILESELAGVIRYTHYSLLVYGYNRIPIVSWLRDQANESLNHAQLAGEMITHLGGYPSLGIGRLLDSHKHDIGKILVEIDGTRSRRARALQGIAVGRRRALGNAGGIRPADDPCRGAACGRSRQDATQTRRSWRDGAWPEDAVGAARYGTKDCCDRSCRPLTTGRASFFDADQRRPPINRRFIGASAGSSIMRNGVVRVLPFVAIAVCLCAASAALAAPETDPPAAANGIFDIASARHAGFERPAWRDAFRDSAIAGDRSVSVAASNKAV